MMYYMVCDKDGLKGMIYPKLKDKNPDFKITESLNKSFIYFLDKIKRKNNGDRSSESRAWTDHRPFRNSGKSKTAADRKGRGINRHHR